MVEYHLFSSKDLSRLCQFGQKVLPGIFLGYVLYAEGIWKGDILVADVKRNWKRWTHLNSTPESSMQRKCLTAMKREIIIFPIADGTVKLSGRDQVLRTSTLIRDNLDRGEEQGNLLGDSDVFSPLQDSSPDDGEARNDFWSISGNNIYRHHVEPGVKTVRAERRILPNSTTIH